MKNIFFKSRDGHFAPRRLFIAVLFLFILVLGPFLSCNVKYEDLGLKESTTFDVGVSNELRNFSQVYFEKKHSLLIEPQSRDSIKAFEAFSSLFVNKNEANRHYEETKQINTSNNFTGTVYKEFKVQTKVIDSSIEPKKDLISFTVRVKSSITTNENDSESGEPIILESIEFYNLTVIKQSKQWLIVREEAVPEVISLIDISEQNSNAIGNNTLQMRNKAETYKYSGTTAAKFAYDHYDISENPIARYTDYTYPPYGGDCTNFLSRCLREGGWLQVDNWFYKSNGKVGNMMAKYQRSASWAGADQFYQYITGTGKTYRLAGGNKRVTKKFEALAVPKPLNLTSTSSIKSWTDFYNTVKSLKKGDIVAIGTGIGSSAKIYHNMIVSQTNLVAPYIRLAYRNYNKNKIFRNRPIKDLPSGELLYGFSVNKSLN